MKKEVAKKLLRALSTLSQVYFLTATIVLKYGTHKGKKRNHGGMDELLSNRN